MTRINTYYIIVIQWLIRLSTLTKCYLLVCSVCTDTIAVSAFGIWEGDKPSDGSQRADSQRCSWCGFSTRNARQHHQGRRLYCCLIPNLRNDAGGRSCSGKKLRFLFCALSRRRVLILHLMIHIQSTYISTLLGNLTRPYSFRYYAGNEKLRCGDQALRWLKKSFFLLYCNGWDQYDRFGIWSFGPIITSSAKVQALLLFLVLSFLPFF